MADTRHHGVCLASYRTLPHKHPPLLDMLFLTGLLGRRSVKQMT